jgi:hypothetical protein
MRCFKHYHFRYLALKLSLLGTQIELAAQDCDRDEIAEILRMLLAEERSAAIGCVMNFR